MATFETARGRLRRLQRALGDQSGAAMVEMAIVMLVFMSLIMGVVDFGRGIAAFSTISHAAREGARAAAYYDTSTWTADVRPAIESQLTALAPEMAAHGRYRDYLPAIEGPWPLGSEVEVRIIYYFEAATPLISGFFPTCVASDPLIFALLGSHDSSWKLRRA